MRSILVFSFLAFCFVGYGQIINFPDARFKNALVNTLCVDTDGDNIGDADADLNDDEEIDVSEALKVEKLSIVNLNISSLEGIQNFDSLISINCSYNDSLTNIKFNNLIKLSNITCNNSGLSSLELNDLPAMSTLDCYNNISLITLSLNNLPNLTYLDCSGTKLSSLELQDYLLLSNLRIYNNPKLTSLTLRNLPNLTQLWNPASNLKSIVLFDLPKLDNIYLNDNDSLQNFSISNLPNLKSLNITRAQLLALVLKDLPMLSTVGINHLIKLELTNLPSLTYLYCCYANLTSLTLKDLPMLTTVITNNNRFKKLELVNLPKLFSLDCSSSELIALDIKDLPSLSKLNCSSNYFLKSLTLTNSPNLKDLDCYSTKITSLVLKDLQLLSYVNCKDNALLKTLTLANLPKLSILDCSYSGLISLDLNNFTSLSYLNCKANSELKTLTLANLPELNYVEFLDSGIISLDFKNLPLIEVLNFGYYNTYKYVKLSKLPELLYFNFPISKVISFDFSDLPMVSNLNLNFDSLSTLQISNLPNLQYLECRSTMLETLDLKDLPLLSVINCSYNSFLKTLKLLNLPELENLDCSNSGLISIQIISERVLEKLNISKIPFIKYICCSEINKQKIITHIEWWEYKNVNVNTYCSFDPFVDFGVMRGNVKFDVNNDGCDDTDKNLTFVNFNILEPYKSGSYILLGDNKYEISLPIGENTITPSVENQRFTISPEFITKDIKKGDTITQDFCITPKGVFRQTNITVIPLSPPARPGFDASYKIVWENVGNQIESGTLNFTYDETLLDYISATQTADQIAEGIIKWNFTNLLPFEKREITVTLKVNRPTDTPAVNAGDKLYLTASILDNIFTLENTVVGSYDPNDKTCLQGDRVKPDMVGEYVDYLIRFENTGNYAAENVVVKDIIDTKTFDVSTLKITDAGHEVYTRIEGNKVEFIFENIQLPFDDANNDGYIAFKIKTLPTLVLGDSLKNLADIYFDYNFPIRTNEAQTTVAFPVFTKDITTEVNIYPNPVTDILYLDTNENWTRAEIFDIAGRIMRSISLDGQSIDVSGLESGAYFIRLKDGDRLAFVKFVKL